MHQRNDPPLLTDEALEDLLKYLEKNCKTPDFYWFVTRHLTASFLKYPDQQGKERMFSLTEKAYKELCELAVRLHETNRKEEKTRAGLYNKFIVSRADGSSAPGGKHENCDYFVLDIQHDPYAIPALLAYADTCEHKYPVLAADLRRRVQTVLDRKNRD